LGADTVDDVGPLLVTLPHNLLGGAAGGAGIARRQLAMVTGCEVAVTEKIVVIV